MQSLKERRQFPRVSAVFPARISSSIDGETVNLSETGLCLSLEKPVVSSFVISIKVDLPFSLPLETQAELIWTSLSLKDNRFRCGVRFIRLAENELQILREVLLKYNILDNTLVMLTRDCRLFLQDTKKKFDQFDNTRPSEQKQSKYIEKNKFAIYKVLNDHFNKAWERMKDLKEEELEIHQKYYQEMLGQLLLDIIETNRYIVKKPLGYAGDYMTMNYIYNFSSGNNYLGNSSFEKLINNYTCNIPISKSNIARKNFLKDKIITTMIKKQPAKILSVGSGPARELVELLQEGKITKPLEFHCLDFEKRALDYLRSKIEEIDLKKRMHLSLKYSNKNLKDIIRSNFTEENREYDMIYCSGVFDYLSDRITKRIIAVLCQMLKKDGSLIIVNADSEKSSHRAYYEVLGDWKFIHRRKEDLLEWVKNIEGLKTIKFETPKEGECYLFLHLKRH